MRPWRLALPASRQDHKRWMRPMRLTLAYHPLTDLRFVATTQWHGTVLEVSEEALRQHLRPRCLTVWAGRCQPCGAAAPGLHWPDSFVAAGGGGRRADPLRRQHCRHGPSAAPSQRVAGRRVSYELQQPCGGNVFLLESSDSSGTVPLAPRRQNHPGRHHCHHGRFRQRRSYP